MIFICLSLKYIKTMDDQEYEKLYKFEKSYWWHVGRRAILESLLKKFLNNKQNQILEIGCGTGGNLKILGYWGKTLGLDNSEKALDFCKKKGLDNVFLGNAEQMDFSNESFDLVVALDVLEHIKEDKKVVKEAWRVLKQNGYFIITVPAYQFLWSEHDKALIHYRRYAASDLANMLQKANFNIIKMSYLVSFVFPFVLGYRILRKILFPNNKKNLAYFSLPKPINNFFILLLKIESFLLQYLDLPFGTSIICIAKKPGLKNPG